MKTVLLAFFILWMTGCSQPDEATSQFGCGTIGDSEVKFEKEFYYFWVSYKGDSDWERGKARRSRGCKDEISSLSLEVYWPDFTPAGNLPIQSDPNPDHITIKIDSVVSGQTDFSRFLSAKAGVGVSQVSKSMFNESLGLYRFTRSLEGREEEYYWRIDGSKVDLFMTCRLVGLENARRCELIQYLPNKSAAVTISFDGVLLGSWGQVSSQSLRFIEVHSIKRS
ncbi:hypothetical protein NVV93_16715 [Pseudomonas sp. LS44]|uniref:hypothetical protein n=1 Tax=Pseudomonas sp. LS44 TaxID=1357074 RepID=UPI00215B6539|nr:hypothetical protein [Pseudomonas sp. LS44]UVE17205.1 hypothetical protein NVV93_16715 [Pseudomonas sp. LS44]